MSRSVAMELVGHRTEAICNRYAIVAEGDLREGVKKVANLHEKSGRKVLPMKSEQLRTVLGQF